MMFKCICFVSLFFCTSLFANDSKTILWQTYHRPPGVIKSGQYLGQGFVQKVLDLVIQRMPEYQHEMPLTTLERAISDIKSKKYACHPSLLITPERESFMYFSNAAIVNPTIRIVAKKGALDKYVYNGAIHLQDIFQQPDLLFAFIKGRSYSPVIDKSIETFLNNDNIFRMSNTDLSPIFQLVEMGRVDASLTYPFEFNYYAEGKKNNSITMYRIADLPEYNMGAIACPKNKWGLEVITKVNAVLAQIKPTTEYTNAMTTWWESERLEPAFQAYYQSDFLNQ